MDELTPEQIRNHAPGVCQSCHGQVKFEGYQTRDIPDGRIAKWPVYAKCKSRSCKVGRKNLGLPPLEEAPEPYRGAPEPSKKVKLYQLGSMTHVQTFFGDMWYALNYRYGRILMGKEDMERIYQACCKSSSVKASWEGNLLIVQDGGKKLEIAPDGLKVTSGWGYFTVQYD